MRTSQDLGSPAREPAGPPARSRRPATLTGFAFTALLLLSAGMASVPNAEDSVGSVRDFYLQHTGVVLVAQLVGLLAAAVFALFAWFVAATMDSRIAAPAVRRWGYGVAVTAAITAVPVLWLCTVSDNGSTELLHRLTEASDWTDVLLFATIAGFSGSVVGATARRWLRGLAGVVGLLAVARAVLIALGTDTLELIAPLAFLVLVVTLSVAGHSKSIASERSLTE
jgi:hypothetical protein